MTGPSKTTAKLLAASTHYTDLYTVEATFARSALAEVNTHRAFSRNSASSRAIPVKKMLKSVEETPFIPRQFSIAQKGMHASEFVTPADGQWHDCVEWWIDSRDKAVAQAKKGLELGLHKQDVNRLLEPFMMHTAIISSTEWQNFFNLRLALDDNGNPLAYPPIYDLALVIKTTINLRTPVFLRELEWHTPLITPDEHSYLSIEERVKVSAARCARVSYVTHDNERDYEEDIKLFDRLASSGHFSPLEHVAQVKYGQHANFNGWKQLRKDYE